ncbi:avidin [Roseomonas frigidaquae]|uniref:Avidin n=1 Tax=Falsiroseomonas frigidaquae TaxID=487318 RepID=A0ABX1F8J8_9PROT|nr:avidin [Falsiroseomonas frigidaquae]
MQHEQALLQAGSSALPVDFSGVWRNQLGSRATLTVTNGTVAGAYESAVSGEGQPITGQLTGYVNGDLISFVVNWPTAALTAWVGQMVNDDGHDVIITLWHMTTNIPEAAEPTRMWQSVFAGTDRFRR